MHLSSLCTRSFASLRMTTQNYVANLGRTTLNLIIDIFDDPLQER